MLQVNNDKNANCYVKNVNDFRVQNAKKLSEYFEKYPDQLQFLAAFETKLQRGYNSSHLELPQKYQRIDLFQHDLLSHHSFRSGSLLAAFAGFEWTLLEIGRQIRHMMLLLKKNKHKFIFIIGYFHPTASVIMLLKHFIALIIKVKLEFPEAKLVVYADYNMNSKVHSQVATDLKDSKDGRDTVLNFARNTMEILGLQRFDAGSKNDDTVGGLDHLLAEPGSVRVQENDHAKQNIFQDSVYHTGLWFELALDDKQEKASVLTFVPKFHRKQIFKRSY